MSAVARVGTDAVARAGLTDRTVEDIRKVLAGQRRWRSPLLFAGPERGLHFAAKAAQ